MISVRASEFARNFGDIMKKAQQGPVEVTSDNKPSGYLISVREFEHLQILKARERRVYTINEMPDELIEAVMKSQMEPGHEHLNALMEED